MRRERAESLPRPPRLTRLIAAGVWPSADGPSMGMQELRPLVSADRVRAFAPDETRICLHPPPFVTVAQEQANGPAGDFWERFGALEQIVPARALIIADFGLGSDSLIVLDYAGDATNPAVRRLRWVPDRRNEWARIADDFDAFADLLGLAGDPG